MRSVTLNYKLECVRKKDEKFKTAMIGYLLN